MAILRSDIERALDELIVHEEGMKFQALAVVLAKLRWEDLVASERKNDLGLDAYVSAATADDHVGKGLACSITPTLSKITSDAEEARKHFEDIRLLIFSTPSKVSNPKKRDWVAKVREKFGYQLEVISREEIIALLMMPANAALCRSFLGIDVPVPTSIEESIERICQATVEVAESWAVRLRGTPLIALHAARLDGKGAESSDVLGLAEIRTALRESRRIVLTAPAGRGKTTTLVQLAQRLGGVGSGSSFLIDLPQWAASRTDILTFIAGMAPFRARAIDINTLAQAQRIEHFSFLLNGWNEVAESESTRAADALRDLERAFPAAGIIVATRTHHIAPPLPGATTLRLLGLTRRQRREYLRARLGARASDLTIMLDGDAVLDDLTRTPFILSEVAALFDAGVTIPASKIAVLREVVHLLEQSHEHRDHLHAPPLRGAQEMYLGALATRMTTRGAVSTAEPEARASVIAVSRELVVQEQITTVPEPADVLNTLCAHHLLERSEYPVAAFRFGHQQFQEYYAAAGVRRQLEQILESGEDEGQRVFARTYLNEPAWTEPLRMIAETVGIEGAEATPAGAFAARLGALLVKLALGVDLVFASELARLSGDRVWADIGPAVVERLRTWYSVQDEHHRRCALVGMVASGSDAFRDILVPLLTADSQQVRLGSYRLWGDFQLSSLGRDWQDLVGGWTEEARVEFVAEILHQRYVPELVSFAVSDESFKVRQAAINGLEWLGVEDEVVRFVDQLKPDDADRVLLESAKHRSLVPDALKPRALAAVRKHLESIDDARERVRVLEQMGELGDASIAERLKDELNKLPDRDIRDGGHPLRDAIETVRGADGGFVSRWLAERVAAGILWPDHWMRFVESVPDDLTEQCLAKLESENLDRLGGLIAVIAAAATPAMAKRVFEKIRELRVAIAAAPNELHAQEYGIARNLDTLFRALPSDVAIAGLSSLLGGEVDAVDLEVVAELFSGVARHDDERLLSVSLEMKRQLRAYLKESISTALRQDDFGGELKAHVSSALAQVGEPEDIADLRTLVRADITRVQVGRDARARGERGRRADAAHMSYTNWHVHALADLGTAEADDFLLELLGEPEYERSVCEELTRRAGPMKTGEPLAQKVEYARIWDARARLARNGNARNQRYADALRAQIETLRSERSRAVESQPAARPLPRARRQPSVTAPYDGRLKQLGNALAALDSGRSADLVLTLMALPGEWDGWIRVEAAERLLFNGVVLPAEPTLSLLDATLNREWGLQDNERWLVKRFLCICPYVDQPSEGFRKMREIMSTVSISWHDMREVATAVGHSHSEDALGFLRELASDRRRLSDMEDAWIDAIAAIDSRDSRELLLSFIDPELPGLPGEAVQLRRDDVLVARVVELARRDQAIERRLLQLCELDPIGQRRELLATIVGWLGTSQALTAGLKLIDDTLSPAVPWRLNQHLEAAFVERRRIESMSPAFSLVAKELNTVRLELCHMVRSDERRRVSAFSLLGAIEAWRLEYGRPSGEPRNPLLEAGAPWPPAEPRHSATSP